MNIVLWILQILLAALFGFAGGMKLILPVGEMTKQMPMPGWFLRSIGLAEVLGAIGLVIPWLVGIQRRLTPIAAAGLVIIMIGAVIVTLMTGDIITALIPLIVGILLTIVSYFRWRSTSNETPQKH